MTNLVLDLRVSMNILRQKWPGILCMCQNEQKIINEEVFLKKGCNFFKKNLFFIFLKWKQVNHYSPATMAYLAFHSDKSRLKILKCFKAGIF